MSRVQSENKRQAQRVTNLFHISITRSRNLQESRLQLTNLSRRTRAVLIKEKEICVDILIPKSLERAHLIKNSWPRKARAIIRLRLPYLS